MRKNRVVEQNRCYHLVSRLAHRAFFLDDEEKDRAVALKARRSERTFADKELSPELLSGVLWAANGFNRPDRRTNATGLNKQ